MVTPERHPGPKVTIIPPQQDALRDALLAYLEQVERQRLDHRPGRFFIGRR
jgi:hypothetical protein